jgi:hypothetical protein
VEKTKMDKETTNSIQENIRLVRPAFEAINTVDLSNVNKLTSPYYVNLASQGFSYSYRSKIRSPDASIDAVKSLRGIFTGLHYDVQKVIAANASGKHAGNFFVIPTTGSSISYDAIHVYRIEDGKRQEHKAIRADLIFMMQLGLAGPALLRQTNKIWHNIL